MGLFVLSPFAFAYTVVKTTGSFTPLKDLTSISIIAAGIFIYSGTNVY